MASFAFASPLTVAMTVAPAQRASWIAAFPTAPAPPATSTAKHLPALWAEGAARGTFTLIGADGTVHREHFEVGPGALLWNYDGMAFLLQNAGEKDAATQLAARVEP